MIVTSVLIATNGQVIVVETQVARFAVIVLKPHYMNSTNKGTVKMTSIIFFAKAEHAMREYEQCFKESHLEEALDFYSRAIAKDATHGEAYYKRSLVYGLLEDYDNQDKDLDMAVRILEVKSKQAPNNEDILYNLGMTYRHYYSLDNSIKHAWNYLTKVLEMNPAYAKAAYGLADILKYEKREYELAIQYYDRAIQMEATNAEYYLERGECFEFLKQYSSALEDYEKVVSLQPNNWKLYNRRGELYIQLKRWTEARNDYQNYRKYAPDLRRAPLISLEKGIVGGTYIEFYFAENADDHKNWNSDSWYLEDSVFIEFYRCFASGFPNFSIYGDFEYSLGDTKQVRDALIESFANLEQIHSYDDFIEHAVKTKFISMLIRCFDDWEIHWPEWLEQLKEINRKLISSIDEAVDSGKKLYFYGV